MRDRTTLTVSVLGRPVRLTVRQLLGLSVTALAAVTLVVAQPAGRPAFAWGIVVAAVLLFWAEPLDPVRRVLDAAGGLVAAALVCLLLLSSGGPDSVLQDVFAVILVYSAVMFPWRRFVLDVAVVAVAALVPGLAGEAAGGFYLDLATDLTVWTGVAVLAGVLDGRLRSAVARSDRLRSVIDDVDDAVAVVDTSTMRIVYANQRVAERTGGSPHDIEGCHPWEVSDAVDERLLRSLVTRLEVGGPALHRDHRSRRSDADDVLATSVRLVAGDRGTPLLVAVARDVTEQRRLAADAIEQAAMVEAADLAMIGTDLHGVVRSWNPAAAELYGIPADEARDRHLDELVDGPADDRLRGRDPFPLDHGVLQWSSTHTDRSGRRFAAELTALPVPAARDTEPGVAVLVRDVSDHRQAVLEAQRREARFRTLAEDVRGVVYRFELGPPLRLTFMSDRMLDLLGDDPADLLGGPGVTRHRVHPDDRAMFVPGHPDNPRETDGVSTYRVRHVDGHWVWVEDHHRPEVDADGRPVAVLGVAFDVTTRKQEERARRRALAHERQLAQELERTVLAQQSFLRSVSHELRTPLTSVRGFTETLHDHRDQLDSELAGQLLARLRANVDRLDRQLADLLDLDLERGQGREHWQHVDLRELAAEAVAALDQDCIEVDVAHLVVVGDRVRLRRAIDALLHNAVRHTPADTSVRLWAEGFDDEVVVHVSDDGPGVCPEVAATMFEPFVQGAEAAAAPSPGTGIGLALVDRVASMHGGRVEYHAASPHGACFCVHLPLQPV